MKALADFASSDAGQTFARIEQHFGRDPAASLEPIDDVLAHNLRAAFLLSRVGDEPTEDPGEVARLGGEKVRKAMSG